MPREYNILDDRVILPDQDNHIEWEYETGRTIYNSDSITSLNKIPVKVLGAFILGGARESGKEVPFSLIDLTENLLIDGTVVIFTDDEGITVFMDRVVQASQERVVQIQKNFSLTGKIVHRIYTLQGSRWEWVDVVHIGTKEQQIIDTFVNGIAKENIMVFLNKKGILYDAQFTYRRLEEIERKVRKTSSNAVSMIVTGYLGLMQPLLDAMKAYDSDTGTLAVPAGTTVQMPKNTTVVDQLHRDFQLLLPNYFKMTNLVEINDAADISGISRRLLMTQTLAFTTLTRKQIQEIYSWFGGTVEFDSLPTMDAEEKTAEYNFLVLLREDKIISKSEFKRRAGNLI